MARDKILVGEQYPVDGGPAAETRRQPRKDLPGRSWSLPALSADLLSRASITEAHRREIADPELFEFNASHFGKHTCRPQWVALAVAAVQGLIGQRHVLVGSCRARQPIRESSFLG